MVFSSKVFCQSADSLYYQSTANRIIKSFEKSNTISKLKNKGLILKEILECGSPSNISFDQYDIRSRGITADSIISIQETNESLIVNFVVNATSHLIISWQTNIEINDDNTLSLICFPIVEAMGHSPIYSRICISINFEKSDDNKFESVILNDNIF